MESTRIEIFEGDGSTSASQERARLVPLGMSTIGGRGNTTSAVALVLRLTQPRIPGTRTQAHTQYTITTTAPHLATQCFSAADDSCCGQCILCSHCSFSPKDQSNAHCGCAEGHIRMVAVHRSPRWNCPKTAGCILRITSNYDWLHLLIAPSAQVPFVFSQPNLPRQNRPNHMLNSDTLKLGISCHPFDALVALFPLLCPLAA